MAMWLSTRFWDMALCEWVVVVECSEECTAFILKELQVTRLLIPEERTPWKLSCSISHLPTYFITCRLSFVQEVLYE
jgi:hypothetical protein